MNDRITLRDIAGYCTEETLWLLMQTLCCAQIGSGNVGSLRPESVGVDGDTFIIYNKVYGASGNTEQVESLERNSDFAPPETEEISAWTDKQSVWNIGALVYYASTGHVLFGGQGGKYQREHPSVLLPQLQKAHDRLNSVVQRCLCHNPDERIEIAELEQQAQRGIEHCRRQERKKTGARKTEDKPQKKNNEAWPEEMV